MLNVEKKCPELIDILGLEKILDSLAKANGMRRCGRVLRTDIDYVLRKALDFELVGGRGQPQMAWRMQVEEQIR